MHLRQHHHFRSSAYFLLEELTVQTKAHHPVHPPRENACQCSLQMGTNFKFETWNPRTFAKCKVRSPALTRNEGYVASQWAIFYQSTLKVIHS